MSAYDDIFCGFGKTTMREHLSGVFGPTVDRSRLSPFPVRDKRNFAYYAAYSSLSNTKSVA